MELEEKIKCEVEKQQKEIMKKLLLIEDKKCYNSFDEDLFHAHISSYGSLEDIS
jgi:hypothetical protein